MNDAMTALWAIRVSRFEDIYDDVAGVFLLKKCIYYNLEERCLVLYENGDHRKMKMVDVAREDGSVDSIIDITGTDVPADAPVAVCSDIIAQIRIFSFYTYYSGTKSKNMC